MGLNYYLAMVVTLGVVNFARAQSENNDYKMSFAELGKLKIESPGTLTPTEKRKVPASATHISADMIKTSGARNLEQLLEIFVPNMQMMRHQPVGTNIGTRGLLFDLNDKVLLLVNGKLMNNRTFYGADSEFMLSMLGDIHHINVIRGPGSSTYGPGAISAVIDIHTWNSRNFDGNSVTLRQGFFEEFSSLELKIGKRFSKDSGIMFYAGADLYQGSDQKYSPQYYGVPVNGVPADDDPNFSIENDQMGFQERPRLKLHFTYDYHDFDLWIRYTQGGKRESGVRRFVESGVASDIDVGYRQLTFAMNYKLELAENLKLKLHTSYDMNDRFRISPQGHAVGKHSIINIREDEIFSKAIFNWSPNDSHEVAFGVEHSFEMFGHPPMGFPHDSYTNTMPNAANARWNTHSFGLFFEHQWSIAEDWTLFTGFRADKHTYTDFMLSPKASLIYTPTAHDTLKLLFNRSVRRTSDAFLRDEYKVTGEESEDVETLDNVELRYEREFGENWSFALTSFYSKLEAIAYDGKTFAQNVPMGDLYLGGGELEISYKSEYTNVIFSHGYTDMLDFEMNDPSNPSNVISSAPYGYDDDLSHWSKHITKLYVDHKLDKQWRVNASAVYYWGYPGAQDYADYSFSQNPPPNVPPVTWTYGDGSSEKAYGPSFYLNAGLEYKPTKNLSFRVDAHNILGWLNKDFNKRNYFFNMETYRDEAAAITLRMEYKF